MGKTNLLDAIHVLCLGKSHFMSTDQNLVRTGEDFFRLQAKFRKLDEKEDIVVKYKLRGKKVFERNKIAYKRLADHVGLLPLVIIAPDDAGLILNGSEERRRFLDFILVQFDSQYMTQLLRYNQIIEQRNALLKSADHPKEVDISLLEVYDAQLPEPAKYIFAKRTEFIEKLYPVFQAYYEEISGGKEVVEISYKSHLQQDSMADLLLLSRDKDLILQRTSKGIHKDDLILELKGKTLKQFASQGQLKSYLLAMKLAQYELLRQAREVTPILLLDDIFDKLDANRVKHLLSLLIEHQFGQIFITDTHEDRVEGILQDIKFSSDYKKFVIADGAAQ